MDEARPSQTACHSLPTAETVTITLPVHPLRGKELAVFRWENGPGGRYALVEHPPGRRTRFPESWTDRGAGWAAPQVAGRAVVLSFQGLLDISRAIRVALEGEDHERDSGKLDSASVIPKLNAVTEHAASHAKTPPDANTTAALDCPGRQRAKQFARSVGDILVHRALHSNVVPTEVSDEREDLGNASGASSGRVLASVDPQAGSREPRVDEPPVRLARSGRGPGLAP